MLIHIIIASLFLGCSATQEISDSAAEGTIAVVDLSTLSKQERAALTAAKQAADGGDATTAAGFHRPGDQPAGQVRRPSSDGGGGAVSHPGGGATGQGRDALVGRPAGQTCDRGGDLRRPGPGDLSGGRSTGSAGIQPDRGPDTRPHEGSREVGRGGDGPGRERPGDGARTAPTIRDRLTHTIARLRCGVSPREVCIIVIGAIVGAIFWNMSKEHKHEPSV